MKTVSITLNSIELNTLISACALAMVKDFKRIERLKNRPPKNPVSGQLSSLACTLASTEELYERLKALRDGE